MARRGVAAVLAVGFVVLVGVLLQSYAVQVFVVPSRSMAPTLQRRDFVVVDRLSYDFGPPRRGDLIVFHFPQADGQSFLKRVIGVPGDIVAEHGGRFWVNGTLLGGPKAKAPGPPVEGMEDSPPARVPAGRYFVLGDNPGASLDSRFWGTVSIREVVGKALFICWSEGTHWWDIRWDRIGRWLR